jgi:hypothetical protein
VVIQNAGYRTAGDTGSAIVGKHDRLTFHFWAFEPKNREEESLGRALDNEGYRELGRSIAGVTVYTDGTRFAWSVHGLWVWLTSAGIVNGTPSGTAKEINGGTLEKLVAATRSTPFEPGSGSDSTDCLPHPLASGGKELDWACEVAEQAGFTLDGTSGALNIVRSFESFDFWAFVPESEEDRSTILKEEKYNLVGTLDGIRLFSDGTRLTWQIHGLHVYLSGVEGIDAATGGVADIVDASKRTPWP